MDNFWVAPQLYSMSDMLCRLTEIFVVFNNAMGMCHLKISLPLSSGLKSETA